MNTCISRIAIYGIAVLAVSCGESKFSSDHDYQKQTSDSGKVKVSEVIDEGVPRPQTEQDRMQSAVQKGQCDESGKKIFICHFPPGNTGNSHTLCIATKALKAHVGIHGDGDDLDYVGQCDESAESAGDPGTDDPGPPPKDNSGVDDDDGSPEPPSRES